MKAYLVGLSIATESFRVNRNDSIGMGSATVSVAAIGVSPMALGRHLVRCPCARSGRRDARALPMNWIVPSKVFPYPP